MPTVTFVTSGGKTFEVDENTNLLVASLRGKGGIPFKCGGGKCGTCRCHIDQGLDHTDAVKPKERNHLSDEEIAAGWRMACQTFVRGDLSVSWVPRDPAAPPPSPTPPAAPDAAP
ncbi:MAG: 2Fe-2S iron-sulfur cluster binding domain-containing protein [Rubrivivax sp.]